MEPPFKRQRLAGKTIPDPDLRRRRARNDSRLKSIFESIFDKYSKNFDGVGDEIDLRTGEIVVNNGHILGIKNQTDTQQTYDVPEDFEINFPSEVEEGEEYRADQVEGVKDGDGSSIPESETASQALYIVNSLVDDAIIEPPTVSLEKSLVEQIADYNSEEDELADKTIEWVTPREALSISHQKWQLPECGPTFTDESTIEEVWRAPLLPDVTPYRGTGHRAAPNAKKVLPSNKKRASEGDTSREPPRDPVSPDTTKMVNPTVPPIETPTKTGYNTSSVKGQRKVLPWTQEEEDQLRHLKATTDWSYRKMEHLFPKRHKESIACKWTQMVNRGDALSTSKRKSRIPPSSSPLVSSALSASRPDEKTNQQYHDRGQQDLSAGARSGGMDMVEIPSNTVAQSMRGCSSNLDGRLDESVECVDSQDKLSRPNFEDSQLNAREALSPSNSPGFRHNAIRRREQLIEGFDSECLEIVGISSTSSGHDLEGPSVRGESSSRASPLISSPLKSQLQEVVASRNAQPADISRAGPTSQQQERSSFRPVSEKAHQRSSSPIKTRRSTRATKLKRSLLATPLEKTRLVQIVIPKPKLHKTSNLAERPKIDLEDQIESDCSCTSGYDQNTAISTTSPRPGGGGIETHEGMWNGVKTPCLEIPDSQPANSSPMIDEEQEESVARLDEQQASDNSLVTSQSSRDVGRQVDTNPIADKDLIDELSITYQPMKKQDEGSAKSLAINAASPKHTFPLTYRPRKRWNEGTVKTAIADSFLSTSIDLRDCSEDELSFM